MLCTRGSDESKSGRSSSLPSLKRSGSRKYSIWSRHVEGLGYTFARGFRFASDTLVGAYCSIVLDMINPNICGGLNYIRYDEIIVVKGTKYFITIDPIICFDDGEVLGEIVAYVRNLCIKPGYYDF